MSGDRCVLWFLSYFIQKKAFISVCPRVGKQAQESSRGALVMRVLFSIHLPIPNSSVWFAENKKDSSLGGAVNCAFFCCTWQKPVFHSTNIGWASPSAHRERWLWPLCGAICLLPRCGIKQMSCAADQAALWRSQQEFLVLSPQKEQCVSYCWTTFGWRGVNF